MKREDNLGSDSLTTYNTTTDGFYRRRIENEDGAVLSNETRVLVYGNIILQGGDKLSILYYVIANQKLC